MAASIQEINQQKFGIPDRHEGGQVALPRSGDVVPVSEDGMFLLSHLGAPHVRKVLSRLWLGSTRVAQKKNGKQKKKTQYVRSSFAVTDSQHGSYRITLWIPPGLFSVQEKKDILKLIAKLNPFVSRPIKMFVWNRETGAAYNRKYHSLHLGRNSFDQAMSFVEHTKAAMVHEMGHGVFQAGGFEQDSEWEFIFQLSLGYRNYVAIDDSTYLPVPDKVGHPFDNSNEAFASSVHAYFLQADQFRDCLLNPKAPKSWRYFGQLVWLYMRDRVFDGQVFTSDGVDPFRNSTVTSVLPKMKKYNLPSLIAAFNDTDPRVIKSAVDQLIGLGREARAVLELMTILKRGSNPLRRFAADTLGEMGSAAKPAVAVLVEAVKGPNEFLQLRALLALRKLADAAKEAVPQLIKILPDASDKTRWAIVSTVFHIDDDASMPGRINKILIKIASTLQEVEDGLKYALKSQHPRVREAAVLVCGEMGEKAQSVLPQLKEMAQNDPDASVRNAAQHAVKQISP